mmetsp:Transcript_111001/g.358318  ORF Transcript_111001/g.358318 Transcript_111001/m.358318 type:complete len:214 (+) Transcript_111001:459-1100(+)
MRFGSTQSPALSARTSSVTQGFGVSFHVQSHWGETTTNLPAACCRPFDRSVFLLCVKKLLPPAPCRYTSMGQHGALSLEPFASFWAAAKLNGKCNENFRCWPVESMKRQLCSLRHWSQQEPTPMFRSHRRLRGMALVGSTLFTAPSRNFTWKRRSCRPSSSTVAICPFRLAAFSRSLSSTIVLLRRGATFLGRTARSMPPRQSGVRTITRPSW